MNKNAVKIAISLENGGLVVMNYIEREVEGVLRTATPENIEAAIARASSGFPAAPETWRIVDTDEIPQDRTFRDAWSDTGCIGVDMPKARDIHRQRLRDARRPQLEALDVAYMRAEEEGDDARKSSIRAAKQVLRDITRHPDIDAAKTPDELKIAATGVLETGI